MDIFDSTRTRRAETALFHLRGDVNDPRLGEVVAYDSAAYPRSDVVILGCPQDDGVIRNRGRPGAARGPMEVRRWLYRLTVNGVENLRICDVGDVVVQRGLEATHEVQRAVVRKLLEDGKRVVVLGGGNDISYPDCAALADVAAGDIGALNVDAHFDVRAEKPCNSGTAYRQLLEGGHLKPVRFVELAYQPFANSPIYADYLRKRNVTMFSLAELRATGLEPTVRKVLVDGPLADAKALHWGFDLDAVTVSDAPGVSAPNPSGLRAEEFCALAALAGADPRTRIVEFTETNPDYDVDGCTCRLVAAAIHNYLAALAASG